MQRESKRNIAIFVVLVPLVTALFVACSSTPKKVELTEGTAQQWNAQVDTTIAEPERAAKLKALGLQLIEVSDSIQRDVDEFNRQATQLNEKYDATHEELQQLVDAFSAKRNPKFAEYRDIIFAMRSEVSPVEWKALNK
jgi:outer membrane murein-binding lipoprotein Lpp